MPCCFLRGTIAPLLYNIPGTRALHALAEVEQVLHGAADGRGPGEQQLVVVHAVSLQLNQGVEDVLPLAELPEEVLDLVLGHVVDGTWVDGEQVCDLCNALWRHVRVS